MSFIKKSIHTGVFRIIKIVVGVMISAIIARELGPQKKGLLSAIMLIPTFIITFGNFGIDISNIYFVAKNPKKISEYFNNSFILSGILTIILIPLGIFIFYLFREKWFMNVQVKYLFYSLLIIPTGLLSKYLMGLLLGLNKIEMSNYIGFIADIVNLSLLLFFLLIYKITVPVMILISIILNLIVLNFTFLYLKNKYKNIKLRFKFYRSNFKEFFLYGFKGHISNILSFLNYRIDMFLVLSFLSTTALGFYTIAVGIAEKLWLLPNIFSTVLFPHISKYEDKNITVFLIKMIFWLMVIIGVFFLFIGKHLIVLIYGKQFVKSFIPFIYLLPGIIFLSIGKIVASDISGRGRTDITMISSGLAAVSNIILNIFFIPRYGLAGAAGASSISYTIHTFYMLINDSKISGYKFVNAFFITNKDIKMTKDIFARLLNFKI